MFDTMSRTNPAPINMHCREVDASLTAYLHGEVGRSERELIRAHMAQCERCQRELARLSAVQTHVSRALHVTADGVKPSPHAWSRLQANLALQRRPSLNQRVRQAFSSALFGQTTLLRGMMLLASVILISAVAVSTTLTYRPSPAALPAAPLPSIKLQPQRFSGPIDEPRPPRPMTPRTLSERVWDARASGIVPDPDANTTTGAGEWFFLLGAAEDGLVRVCANCTQLQ